MQPARIEMIEKDTAKLEKPLMPRWSSCLYPSSASIDSSSADSVLTPRALTVSDVDGGTLMHYLANIAQQTFVRRCQWCWASSTGQTVSVNGSGSNLYCR
ncbi:hypothetical protein GCM10028802_15220 [Terrabacter terrigena]